MAGHSHWANIAHKKGIADAKRGKLWSKLSRAIIVAARHGGGDPDTNLKLRYAIDKARQVSMPKDNIERAIKRGTGELGGENLEEFVYEGIGPDGVAILVDILSDNRNRTNGDIRKIFERGGGKMGSAGCVAHLFERKGVIAIPRNAIAEDDLMAIILEAGADDMKIVGDQYEIITDPSVFNAVKQALDSHKILMTMAEITKVATLQKEVDEETGRKIIKLIEALEDNDDVQAVFSNASLTEKMFSD